MQFVVFWDAVRQRGVNFRGYWICISSPGTSFTDSPLSLTPFPFFRIITLPRRYVSRVLKGFGGVKSCEQKVVLRAQPYLPFP